MNKKSYSSKPDEAERKALKIVRNIFKRMGNAINNLKSKLLQFFQSNSKKGLVFNAKEWLGNLLEFGPKVETEFLPGALEVSESPPSPLGRLIIWTIVVFLLLLVLWASLSKVEVVAVASGKLIPRGQVKAIQSSELGVVREVAVRDGQRVKEGDLLISLDPTTSEADELNLSYQLLRAHCELALQDALINWIPSSNGFNDIDLPLNATQTIKELYNSRFKQEVSVLEDSLASIKSDYVRLEAQSQRIEQTAKKYREVLQIDTDITRNLKDLYMKQVSSRLQWLQAEQQRIRNEQDLAATMEQISENTAMRQGLEREMELTISQFRSDALKAKSDIENEIDSKEQELSKATRRNTLRLLTAPVSGQVQELAVHTIGGVVEGAKTLLVIVPEGTELEVEVSILNKDVGFIKPGQKVAVKLEAFPFTEYGFIPGKVEYISGDAVADKDGNLLFLCKVTLLQDYIVVNGERVMLGPGMNATAEIVLRERRLITYFLSPLIKQGKESLRER